MEVVDQKQCSRCHNIENKINEHENTRRQCNERISNRHEYYKNDKDKHYEWDRKHYQSHSKQEKVNRA